MAQLQGVSFTYQATNAQVTGDNAGTEPTLDTILVKITGSTVATNDNLKFYVDSKNGTSAIVPLSWTYKVQAADDFATAGVAFTVNPLLLLTASTVFTDGKVYDGAIWNF
ncbi:hypothetical protein [Niameybacter massiliensis]|uniref:hypothetical protein n=1 Tax=Niameybacter massiliensis TaxID=1658108 RepID=UPI0006B49A4F|nr:hypothetical protein [Niameybacter massiliensis]